MLLSNMMPRLMPVTADRMKMTVRTDIATTTKPLPSMSWPVTIEVPVLICNAPMPRDVAVPKSVTSTAAMSMIFPSARLDPSGKTGSKTAEISGGRPRRYVE